MIWLTSDWHFLHDREFIWRPRGFDSVQEMNEALILRHNALVSDEDTVYVLGDLMLGSNLDEGMALISRMKGKINIIRGNHDTDRRVAAYRELYPVYDALYVKHDGYQLYLSHFPTITSNLEKEHLKQCTIGLFGHTHQKTNFYYDIPYMYHVGVDSHACCPVCFEVMIKEMKAKVRECEEML